MPTYRCQLIVEVFADTPAQLKRAAGAVLQQFDPWALGIDAHLTVGSLEVDEDDCGAFELAEDDEEDDAEDDVEDDDQPG